MNYWTQAAEWLDAEGLLAWLEQRGVTPQSCVAFRERIAGWRNGSRRTSIWSADEVLTRHGFHLSDLPDELWVDSPQKGPHHMTDSDWRTALKAYADGEPVDEIARRFGMQPETLGHKASRGGILRPPKPAVDPESLVHKRGREDCWPWTGSTMNGYPSIYVEGKRLNPARIMAERDGMELAKGQRVIRSCGNKACCNPAHLVAGTTATAMRMMTGRAA